MRNSDMRPNPTIPARLPRMLAVYAATRFGIALNARPISCPSPTNDRATSRKNSPAIDSIGTTNVPGS
jgi:hypothetical protein